MVFGEMPIWRNFHLAKCPFCETPLRRNSFDEMGFDEMVFGEKSGYHGRALLTSVSLLEKDKRRNRSIYLLKGA
jgi:hypothetical protein